MKERKNMKSPFESGKIRVTSLYGNRNGVFHKGMDLVGVSSKRVVAVEDATVGVSTIITDRSNRTWEWGNYVRLDLDDGKRLYHCHLANRLVKTGERVRKGQVIGIAGETGNATGVHLHWELRPAGYSTESLNISEWSGIPNKIGTYAPESAQAPDEAPDTGAQGDFHVGQKVVIRPGAVYTNGVKVPDKYIGVPYTVQEVKKGKVLIEELYSWVSDSYVSAANDSSGAASSEIRTGDTVKILPGAVYSNGVKVPKRYLGVPMTVEQVKPDRILIKELNSWVLRQYIEQV